MLDICELFNESEKIQAILHEVKDFANTSSILYSHVQESVEWKYTQLACEHRDIYVPNKMQL